jgi:hypothetical protein
MLLRVGLPGDAFFEDPHLQQADFEAAHERVVELLARQGVLAFGDESDLRDFKQSLQNTSLLGASLKAAWNETLLTLAQYGRIEFLGQRLALLESLVEVRKILNPRKVAVITAGSEEIEGYVEEAKRLAGTGQVIKPEISELVRLDQTSLARRYTRLVAEPEPLAVGSSREDFWDEILEPLVATTPGIVISDPYLLKQLWVDRRATEPNEQDHVSWLINKINKHGRPDTRITLLSGAATDHQNYSSSDPDELLSILKRRLKIGRNVSQVKIAIYSGTTRDVHNREMKDRDWTHSRHISLASGFLVQIPEGLDRLRSQKLRVEAVEWQFRTFRTSSEITKKQQQRIATANSSVWSAATQSAANSHYP